MSEGQIFHALGLHMHQPPGNMLRLIDEYPGEAQQIIHCYDRATRYAHKYTGTAFLHIGFSGILLEQLRDPLIVDRYRAHMDIPAMLNSYREADNIELIGMGYYHPIFPLIPVADWEDQLVSGRQIMEELFGRAPKGFYPPELAFTPEMIPALVKAGYEYVVLDSAHLRPADGIQDSYQPYLARYGSASIVMVPLDRALSSAQSTGIDPAWFANEARYKARHAPHSDQPRLITTWSDGENGDWFRRMEEQQGFFGYYFGPYIEHVRNGEYPVTPVSLAQFIQDHPPQIEADVQDFSGWQGSEAQTAALARIRAASAQTAQNPEARRWVLESQTSCFLFWGDQWLEAVDERLKQAEKLLQPAESEPAAVPVEEPAVEPVVKPAEKMIEKAVAEPEQTQAEKPVEEVTAKPDENPAETVVSKPAEKEIEKQAETPVEKTPVAPAKPATKKSTTAKTGITSRSRKK